MIRIGQIAPEQALSFQDVPRHRRYRAYRALFLGLGTAATLTLFASGKHKEAYAIGIVGALVAAFTEFAREITEE